MKRLMPAAAGLAIFALTLAAGWCFHEALFPAAPKPPRLVMPGVIDLGEQELNTRVTARFTLENQGGAPLAIDPLPGACACSGLEEEVNGTPQRVERLILAPGEKRQLMTRLLISARPGTNQFQQSLPLQTNDPERPRAELILSVRYNVSTLMAVPDQIAVGAVPLGEARKFKVNLRDESQPPRRLSRVVSPDERFIQARLLQQQNGTAAPTSSAPRPGDLSQPVGLLEVSAPATHAGTFDFEVEVFAEGVPKPVHRLRAYGRIVAPVEVSPTQIRLPRHSGSGLIWTAHFTVRGLGAVALEPVGLPADFSVEVAGTDQDAVRPVRVTWHPERRLERSDADPVEITLRARCGDAIVPLTLQVWLRTAEAP